MSESMQGLTQSVKAQLATTCSPTELAEVHALAVQILQNLPEGGAGSQMGALWLATAAQQEYGTAAIVALLEARGHA